MTASASRPRADVHGILAVAATYVYFLLYAQFGFLARIRQFHADPVVIEHALGLMGAGGLIASAAAAWLLGRQPARRLLLAGFSLCALAALLTLAGGAQSLIFGAALSIGAGAGLLTVTLAASLRSFFHAPGFATRVGVGTGLAYFICNLPPVFSGSPVFQALFAAAACGVGLVAVWSAPAAAPAATDGASRIPISGASCRGAGFAALVAMLFALVCLDSTAFATIQQTPALKAYTWGTPALKLMLGAVHAAAAVVAGRMIDRGWFRRLLVLAFGLFALAFTWLQGGGGTAWAAGSLYATGISAYSVALVVLPTLHPEGPGLIPVRWRSALLYALAGWIGSAFGVGLAQHLTTIPITLVLGAGAVVALGALFPLTPARLRLLRDYQLLLPFALLAVLVYSGLFALPTPPPAPGPAAAIARGRQVYMQEGCINCHSQFVRPHTVDAQIWGPAREVDAEERPPLIGNRRQGPDLMNVGLRRGALWQRQHLLNPASTSPGSAMPSYAALFRDGDLRGPDLVAYLGSLGAAHGPERVAAIAAWSPRAAGAPSLASDADTFERLCATCHGTTARGDGPTARVFQQPAMNLRKGNYQHIPNDLAADAETLALARIVKFGVSGLNMPGHETLSDAAILDVVAYIRRLNHRESP